MKIRETKKEDLKGVMRIIRMAQEFFREHKIDQWQDGYPNEEVILEDIRQNQSYLMEKENQTVGTAVISLKREHTYEKMEQGHWITEDKAKYVVIHRIATHREFKREGIASAFLEFAECKGREHHVQSIRIDTHPENTIMQKWLKKHGFCYCGKIHLESGALRYAYEKVL